MHVIYTPRVAKAEEVTHAQSHTHAHAHTCARTTHQDRGPLRTAAEENTVFKPYPYIPGAEEQKNFYVSPEKNTKHETTSYDNSQKHAGPSLTNSAMPLSHQQLHAAQGAPPPHNNDVTHHVLDALAAAKAGLITRETVIIRAPKYPQV